jgi:adenosylcobinamide amidohydrolase
MISAPPARARLHLGSRLIAIESEGELTIASTAVFGGGLTKGRCIVSIQVPANYSGMDPSADIRNIAAQDCWRPDVGLMTAVDVSLAQVAEVSAEGITTTVVVTAGVGRPWAAGSPRPAAAGVGTINIIALLDTGLEIPAALNVMTTITEAKVLALSEAAVRTREGEPASGTASDAVVVAWPSEGARTWKFGGPATAPGWTAAAATRAALRSALEAAHIRKTTSPSPRTSLWGTRGAI